jgi:AAA domain
VLVHGKTGTYKTFLVLDLFASLVLGRDWLGHPVKERGRVLYVAAEGAETIAERLDGWGQQTGESIPSEQFSVMTTPARLNSADAMAELMLWIELHEPIAVAIDTLSKSMGAGTDENSNSDMSAALTVVDRIKAQGITVVLIHHPGHEHQQRARGASALEIGVDTSIRVEKISELHGKLTCEKQKRSKPFAGIAFQLAEQIVPGATDDEPETTLAVVGTVGRYAAGAQEAEAKQDRQVAKRTAVLDYLAEHDQATESVIAKACEGLRSLSGDYRKRFFDAMAAAGLIEPAGKERQSRLWRLPTV